MGLIMENEWFHAAVSLTGGEITSLFEKKTGTEYLWQADPSWWKGTAPILFPVIGGLLNESYHYAGQTYSLPAHGFARKSDFLIQERDDDEVTLFFSSSDETLKNYPFEFIFSVRYILERGGVTISYSVMNTGSSTMYFSLGSHPAFNLPFAGGAFENHYILWEREEDMERFYFKDGLLVAGKSDQASHSRRILSLSRNTFDSGPLIFMNPNSREFSLRNSLNNRAIKVVTDGVPYFALWSKPDGAPFVCIEPWHGIPDWSNASGNLVEKEGIIPLDAGLSWSSGYRIEIHH